MTTKATARMAAALLGTAIVFPAFAAEDGGLGETLALDAPSFMLGEAELRLGGFAGGALYTARQSEGPARPDGYDNTGISGLASANIRIQRVYDTGLILGVRSDFLLYHDDLSSDAYDNDTVQRLYLFAQTGFGRVELGQTDGAGAILGRTGPHVDPMVTLENRGVSLFRDPVSDEDFAGFFHQVTSLNSTSNYAKITYTSPRLLGVQLGASFTPNTVRSPLPYTGNPDDAPDIQSNIIEVAGSYEDYIGDLAYGVSLAYARGALKNRTFGSDNLYDWSIGAELSYTLSDVKLSAGGAYRYTNAYLSDIDRVLDISRSRLATVSLMAETGPWRVGTEYSYADLDGPNDINVAGAQASGGYRINDNMQFTLGWQWYDYHQGVGVFYNGRPRIHMNAGFMTLSYTL